MHRIEHTVFAFHILEPFVFETPTRNCFIGQTSTTKMIFRGLTFLTATKGTTQPPRSEKTKWQRNVTRLIDGSRSCESLLLEHLEICWGFSLGGFDAFTDGEGGLAGFFKGGLFVQLSFDKDDSLRMYTCIFNPFNDGSLKLARVEAAIQTEKSLRSHKMEILFHNDDGTVWLAQRVSVATLLIDAEAEETIKFFLDTSTNLRTGLKNKRRRRRSLLSGLLNGWRGDLALKVNSGAAGTTPILGSNKVDTLNYH